MDRTEFVCALLRAGFDSREADHVLNHSLHKFGEPTLRALGIAIHAREEKLRARDKARAAVTIDGAMKLAEAALAGEQAPSEDDAFPTGMHPVARGPS